MSYTVHYYYRVSFHFGGLDSPEVVHLSNLEVWVPSKQLTKRSVSYQFTKQEQVTQATKLETHQKKPSKLIAT